MYQTLSTAHRDAENELKTLKAENMRYNEGSYVMKRFTSFCDDIFRLRPARRLDTPQPVHKTLTMIKQVSKIQKTVNCNR